MNQIFNITQDDLDAAVKTAMDVAAPVSAFPVTAAGLDRNGQQWSDYEDRWIVWLRERGYKVPQIAAIIGRSQPTTYNRLRIVGATKFSRQVWDAAEWARALDLLRVQGLSVAEVALKLGRNEVQIWSKLKYENVSLGRVRRWSDADSRALRETLEAGGDLEQLGAKLDRDQAYLRHHARAAGLGDLLPRIIRTKVLCQVEPEHEIKPDNQAGQGVVTPARPRPNLFWTKDRKREIGDEILRLGYASDTLADIAKRFGTTAEQVRLFGRDQKLIPLQRVAKGLTPDNQAKAKELADQGLLITAAANQLSCDVRTLKAFAAAHGFEFKAYVRDRSDRARMASVPRVAAPKPVKAQEAAKARVHKNPVAKAPAVKLVALPRIAGSVRETVPGVGRIQTQKVQVPVLAATRTRQVLAAGSSAVRAPAPVVAPATNSKAGTAEQALREAVTRFEAGRAARAGIETLKVETPAQKPPVTLVKAPASKASKSSGSKSCGSNFQGIGHAAFNRHVRNAPRSAANKGAVLLTPHQQALNLRDSNADAITRFLAQKGVTRAGAGDPVEAMVREIRARGYSVISQDAGYLINARIVIADRKALWDFAQARNIGVGITMPAEEKSGVKKNVENEELVA